MKLYSSGEVADMLGIHRDKVQSEIKAGAPRPSMRLGKRMAFTKKDVESFASWLRERGISIRETISEMQSTA